MLPPWTYTLLNDFNNCPRKAYHKYIAKDLPREEKSAAQLHGILMHKGFERAINEVDAIGPEIDAVQPFRHMWGPLKRAGARAEFKMGIAPDGTSASFWSNPWGRGVADVLVMPDPRVALLVDWKTGKVREDKVELECQAVLAKANYPQLEKITGCYGWLQENRLGKVYDLSDTAWAARSIAARVHEMQECADHESWPEAPNALCGWCPVKQCKHNRSAV
jgi:hypothetical protein